MLHTPRRPVIAVSGSVGERTWSYTAARQRMGAAARHPYRVLRLLDPPRLVIDVAHAPATSTP